MIEGKNPQDVFYDECRRRGVNPNIVLNLAKMVSGRR